MLKQPRSQSVQVTAGVEIDDHLTVRMANEIKSQCRDRADDEYNRVFNLFRAQLEDIKSRAQSRLEVFFASYIIGMTDGYNYVTYVRDWPNFEAPKSGTVWGFQVDLAKYTADFIFTLFCESQSRTIVVECDGHERHEKTKEQVARDKQRDRFLVKEGISVLRFSGSEVYNDPESCVGEISDALSARIDSAIGQPRAQSLISTHVLPKSYQKQFEISSPWAKTP